MRASPTNQLYRSSSADRQSWVPSEHFANLLDDSRTVSNRLRVAINPDRRDPSYPTQAAGCRLLVTRKSNGHDCHDRVRIATFGCPIFPIELVVDPNLR